MTRTRRTIALTALAGFAALALAGCGKAATAATTVAPPAERPAASRSMDEETAFLFMLTHVEEPCAPDLEVPEPGSPDPEDSRDPAPGEAPRSSRPTEPLPVDTTVPLPSAGADTRSPAREAEPAKVELSRTERCAGDLHIARVTKALDALPDDPSPAQVRQALNNLGYIDSSIHALERSGTTTRFVLDLRFMDGQLCLDGLVAGKKASVKAFGAEAEAESCTGRSRGSGGDA